MPQSALGLHPQSPGLRQGAEGICSKSLGPSAPSPPMNPGEDHPDSILRERPQDYQPLFFMTLPDLPFLLGIVPRPYPVHPGPTFSPFPPIRLTGLPGTVGALHKGTLPKTPLASRLVYLLQLSAFKEGDTIFLIRTKMSQGADKGPANSGSVHRRSYLLPVWGLLGTSERVTCWL